MIRRIAGWGTLTLMTAGILTGCGVIHAAQHLKNDVLAQYANGQPINKAALEKKFGQILYYGSTPASIGAPAKPPFSLSQYPAQHTIEWGATVSKGLTASEHTAAADAATWFMEYAGNHLFSIVSWGNPYEYFYLKGSKKKLTGVQQQYLDTAIGIDGGKPSAAIPPPKNIGYAYRTWSTVTHVWAVPAKSYEQYKGITFTKPVEHLVAATVMVHQIQAWDGKYYYYPIIVGPATIYMAEMNHRWYYSSKTSWPQNNLVHQLPGSYVPHFPKAP